MKQFTSQFICLTLLFAAASTSAFLPVPGVHNLNVVSDVYIDGSYVAQQPFESDQSMEQVLENCRMMVEAMDWEPVESCSDLLDAVPFGGDKYRNMVMAKAGDVTWIAFVDDERSCGGCSGRFVVMFPGDCRAELPGIGLIYPGGDVTMNASHREGAQQSVSLVLETVEMPDIVLPYVRDRLRQVGWRQNMDVQNITQFFGQGDSVGAMFYSDSGALWIMAAPSDGVHWQYLFKLQRNVTTEGRL